MTGYDEKYIDISWPITPNMTAYRDKRTVKMDPLRTWPNDQARETFLCMNVHSGTHIDAPAHFLEHGVTSEALDLTKVNGCCRVLDLLGIKGAITAADLEEFEIQGGERILLKTNNSLLIPTAPFEPDFVYLQADAAEFLVAHRVRSVGIDYLGIERNQPGHETHKLLLSHRIPIIEGLRLRRVQPGTYDLMCLPLAVVGIDAAPARALLLPN